MNQTMMSFPNCTKKRRNLSNSSTNLETLSNKQNSRYRNSSEINLPTQPFSQLQTLDKSNLKPLKSSPKIQSKVKMNLTQFK